MKISIPYLHRRTSVARTLMARLLVLEFPGKSHSCRFGIIKGDFLFDIKKGKLRVLIRIAS